VELRRQIAEGIAWLKANPYHPDRDRRLQEVNGWIDRHNRLVPILPSPFPGCRLTLGGKGTPGRRGPENSFHLKEYQRCAL